ncbi:unnamed protein product [Tetraodon nigroviridis]|uniref:(spotted green pufferfish) hypothetical protein n=1 Tax=Tetraodon nigroviridis TaxID=99883 RepID=Q4SIS6_TETNG|nr:unnamed protein product [Tetraodon nigroviridis]
MDKYLMSAVLLSVCGLGFSQECRKDFQNNIDFPGTDVSQIYASDAERCQELCTDHHSCLFFTFIRPDWTRDTRHFYCYLKFTASGEPKTKTPLLGVTSGYSLKPCTSELTGPYLPLVYQNIDFLGADYRFLFTANYEDCQRVCTEDPSCRFFTFTNGDFSPEAYRYKCHLKYSWTVPRPPVIVALANVVSGFSNNLQMPFPRFDTACEGKLFPNIDIEGNHFEEVAAVSDEHCQMLCTAHPRCTLFSFASQGFSCRLRDNLNAMEIKAKLGVTSGIPGRGCHLSDSWARAPYPGVDFRGVDIRYTLVDNAEACQQACNDEDKCQFYTYVKENFRDPAYSLSP